MVLKTVNPEAPTALGQTHLRREFEILRGLRLPGIVEALDFVELDSGPALVLADAGPRTLRGRLADGPLELATALRLAAELADVLASVHDAGLIHRDVKPDNVVLTEDDAPILVDFGLALAAGSPWDSELLVGTLAYIAPEQTGRTGRAVDHRADLYGLGATLYQMLTGGPPFASEDGVGLVHAHLVRTPPPLGDAVPAGVATIVMKLLAKSPDDRYQSAAGVAADLRRALDTLIATGTSDRFELGSEDTPQRLVLGQVLYGREREIAAVAEAFEDADASAASLLMVTGPTGVGKSALIHRTLAGLAKGRALLVSVACDPLRADAPLAPLAELIGRRLERILTSSEATLEQIRAALGPQAGALGELIPELELLLGPLPAPPKVGAVESRERLRASLTALFDGLAGAGAPTVMVIDDAQHMQPMLGPLLARILGTDARNFLAVLIWGGDPEATKALRERLTMRAAASGKACRSLALGPLDRDGVTALLAGTLGGSGADRAEAGGRIYQRTGGNPLFIERVLRHLELHGALRFDSATRAWRIDLEQLGAVPLADDVVTMLVESARNLGDECRRLLALGGCLGERFRLGDLARRAAMEPRSVRAALAPAINAGVLQTDERWTYRFVHEAVTRSACDALDQAERAAVHLVTARELVSSAVDDAAVRFQALHHFEEAGPLLSRPAERLAVVRLHLAAARQCRASAAHEEALSHYARARVLLPPEAWESLPQLLLELTGDGAESAFLANDRDEGEQLVAEARSHAPDTETNVRLLDLLVVQRTLSGDYGGAIAAGHEALSVLGRGLPEGPAAEHLDAEAAATRAALAELSLDELANRGVPQERESLAEAKVLADLLPATYFTDGPLFSLLVCRMVQRSISHGHTAYSGPAFVSYAAFLQGEGELAAALTYGRLGLDLARRLGGPSEQARALHVFAHHVNHWGAHVRTDVDLLKEAVRTGLEGGAVLWAGYAATGVATARWSRGAPLDGVVADLDRAQALARQTDHRMVLDILVGYRQVVRALKGDTAARGHLASPDFDPDAHRAAAGKNPTALTLLDVLELQLAVIFGDVRRALSVAADLRGREPFVVGMFASAERTLYEGLAHTQAATTADAQERRAHLARAEELRGQLARWAAYGEANFSAGALLLEAELHRLAEHHAAAADAYEEAIACAQRNGFIQVEAVSLEFASHFYSAWGKLRSAERYLGDASGCYAAWGATDKVEALKLTRRFGRRRGDGSRLTTTTTQAEVGALATHQAALALSGEMRFLPLLERLMATVLAEAGAERAVLLLPGDGDLAIAAEALAASPRVTMKSVPLNEAEYHLATHVIRLAQRTKSRAMVDDARQPGVFADDPYLKSGRTKSVLALPLLRQRALVGVLYVEHGGTTQAFPRQSSEALQLLAAQTAISLENVRLVEDLRREVGERMSVEAALRELNEQLEARVEARTGEIRAVNAELARSNADLARFASVASHDLQEPLRMVAAYTRLIERHYGPHLDDTAKLYLRHVVDGSRRMRNLITDLLEYARLGRAQFDPMPVDLGEVVAELRETFSPRVGEVGGSLTAGSMPRVLGVRPQLARALQNLISNGLKFRSEAAPAVHVAAEREGARWRISVQDNGLGIAAEDISRVLEPFQRLHSQDEVPGTGLGLAVVKRIAEIHGSDVTISETPGGGTTVSFTIAAV